MTAPRLEPGLVVFAASVALEHEPVPADQVVAGEPTTGHLVLDDQGPVTIGVWEMSVGAMSDVEADEVFVVLAGDATVEFTGGPGHDTGLDSIELQAGSVVRLVAGMETVWTVRAPLRKVYLA
ncbi:cupin [Agromyces rhizosphaerae]|uniref:Cupin n=1 Tax=Agromyces rhizosphaerae TaxID=88374 RepID=A0A9W6CZJ8_9MICO|nr:cupin domain-containing protein [Agromyces rhizosphaerae]GLI26753.1 cupin [Agromyces rhizosphaerae]